jgi:hypothetical protein
MSAQRGFSVGCPLSNNWHNYCKFIATVATKVPTMANGPHIVHNRLPRLWWWIGLCIGAAGGLAIGWLISS